MAFLATYLPVFVFAEGFSIGMLGPNFCAYLCWENVHINVRDSSTARKKSNNGPYPSNFKQQADTKNMLLIALPWHFGEFVYFFAFFHSSVVVQSNECWMVFVCPVFRHPQKLKPHTFLDYHLFTQQQHFTKINLYVPEQTHTHAELHHPIWVEREGKKAVEIYTQHSRGIEITKNSKKRKIT